MRSHLPVIALSALFALTLAACGERQTGSSGTAAAPKAVDRLNSLLRGELSAVETYRQAIAKEGSASVELNRLRADHDDAASQLAARVKALGGVPATDPGVWGDFTKALEGAAKVFGNDAAMQALKAGEKLGTSSYERALDDADLDAASKDLIRNTLLPRQREHADVLQRRIDVPSEPVR
jgi:bacterioferritin (cytochrome b1)